MRGSNLAELRAPLSDVDGALDLVDGFDDALGHGFARLGEERAGRLTVLAGAVAGSPLGDAVADAVAKVAAGSVSEEHLSALAAARAALLGAAHDALLARCDAALGRTRESWQPSASEGPPVAPNLLAGVRAWLTEVAVTGWRGVDHELVSASAPLVEALYGEPALRRVAVLLDGLTDELRASSPVATMPRLPERRWADLWSRALLLTRAGAWGAAGATDVTGRLLVLGVDVHEHATAVRVQVHGVLEPAGGDTPRLVRTNLVAAKVDTIVGPAVWQLFGDRPVLLGALAGGHALDLVDMPLLPGGDLVWHDERASAGAPADPFATARVLLPGAVAPPVHPLDRHPVGVATPVLIEGFTAGEGGFDIDGETLTVDVESLPDCGPLTAEAVAAAEACIGLLRWDAGRWSLRPLAVRGTVKRKPVATHTGDWALGPTDPKVVKAAAKAGDAVSVLRERAGRLLRK
ncbi:hypothetical protein Val02_07930 [Virgisporangium aliadipatigenens]|uniref:Uncharacterized protein n=1 Tax=Virgisporangium aliadipatigenens TaxID=741659 RepID=A0A8J3YGC9_9ACTN|nr:hypothetical protein [Virgisporangium aliadipatigenens]GIJ43907.1 hypothetical protein Val02_07930 [Virgisporangium aliadipatigenens]